jgi:hypothetical protein
MTTDDAPIREPMRPYRRPRRMRPTGPHRHARKIRTQAPRSATTTQTGRAV